jgi:hypothetical protein
MQLESVHDGVEVFGKALGLPRGLVRWFGAPSIPPDIVSNLRHVGSSSKQQPGLLTKYAFAVHLGSLKMSSKAIELMENPWMKTIDGLDESPAASA